MKVRLLSSTNKLINEHIGKKFNCRRLNGWLELEFLDKPDYGIQTSRIEKVVRTEDSDEKKKIFVFTKNSSYELEVLDEANNENN